MDFTCGCLRADSCLCWIPQVIKAIYNAIFLIFSWVAQAKVNILQSLKNILNGLVYCVKQSDLNYPSIIFYVAICSSTVLF